MNGDTEAGSKIIRFYPKLKKDSLLLLPRSSCRAPAGISTYQSSPANGAERLMVLVFRENEKSRDCGLKVTRHT